MEDGTVVTQNTNAEHLKDSVRVYNADFIDANFRWAQGQANPVFYIGKEQADLVTELKTTQTALEKARAVLAATKANKKNTEKALGEFKTNTARDIEAEIRLSRRYRSNNLQDDYCRAQDGQFVLLEAEALQKQKDIAASANPPEKFSLLPSLPSLSSLLENISQVVTKVATTQVLDELNLHPSMETWVRHGFVYHKDQKLGNCLLCSNAISQDRLGQLASAFDDAYAKLLSQIDSAKSELQHQKHAAEALGSRFPEQAKFAPPAVEGYDMAREAIETLITSGNRLFEQIETVLEAKRQSLNKSFEDGLPASGSAKSFDEEASKVMSQLNSLIQRHNEYHDNFLSLKAGAFDAIRSHYLAANMSQYKTLLEADTKADEELKKIQEEGKALGNREEDLRSKMQNHATAGKSISALVNNFLSHSEICIEPVDSGYELRRRDGSVIKSLSDGEKRAITFCYFLATLQEDGKTAKDFIVVIDDPISSLDTKALNYTSCLIRRTLETAGQLFILTHNLHFMHEMRKWIASKNFVQNAKENGLPIPLYFLETKQCSAEVDRSSSIVSLPVLLREHESEYHYLFSIVQKCADSADQSTEFLYLMPNAMRKMLEVFLSFKVPGGGGLSNQLRSGVIRDKVAKENGDMARFHAVERLAEIESHGDSLDPIFELPLMTVEETHQGAAALLELIKLIDPDHFQQMERISRKHAA
ncbi:AAA family ATPase [Rhodomicrobium vannielii ATCC 17100]|uniref:AAA family ATPase n=1 Tax=Rhodomicrobium vannielii TaxID=1069 RepID=UPI0019197327|nr:AAA family ATPase [Rhodomicrobium vannielii]MBJ7532650.1 AAA family ATPase [Rhodomicrobium vannielii ATCC 17100]